jgi:RNA polymerase sigma factor (sigma-70 family)
MPLRGAGDPEQGEPRTGVFPNTHWSLFSSLESVDEATRRTAFETLTVSYWRPVWAVIRARTRLPPEDASDLTQDFFLWIIETKFLSRADRARGRFRAFVSVALQNYLTGVQRKERTLKRGGGQLLPLQEAPEVDLSVDDSPQADPDRFLTTQWASDLLERATSRLQESYESEGKSTHFELFHEYFIGPTVTRDYNDLASKYQLSSGKVSKSLFQARQRFRGILRGLVGETVSTAEDLEGEMQSLFGGGAP